MRSFVKFALSQSGANCSKGHPAGLHEAHAPKRQRDGVDKIGAIADVQPQNEVDVKPGKYRDRKRTVMDTRVRMVILPTILG